MNRGRRTAETLGLKRYVPMIYSEIGLETYKVVIISLVVEIHTLYY